MRIILFLLTIYAMPALSQGRAPAVEPHLEIAAEGYEGNERLGETAAYNFTQSNIWNNPNQEPQIVTGFSFATLFILLAFITLPFASWFLIMRQTPKTEANGENVVHVQFKKKDNDESDDDDFSQAA
jgi:hypothetical protein